MRVSLPSRSKVDWSSLLRGFGPYAASAAFAYLALALLRHALVLDLGMSLDDALGAGLGLGLYFDLYALLLAAIIVQVAWGVASVPRWVGWPASIGLVWLAGLANVLHYRFFDMRLDLWVVALHWKDLLVVHESAAQLAMSWPIIISIIVAGLAVGLVPIARKLAPIPARNLPPPPPTVRGRRLAVALLLLVLLAAMHRAPRVLGLRYTGSVLADNIVRVWVTELTSTHPYVGAGLDWADNLGDGDLAKDRAAPSRQLSRYRDVQDNGGALTFASLPGSEPERPLVRMLEPSVEETRAIRARLGLPVDGPINVILLFLESARAFELYHPALGPQIFPELRAVLAEHAIQFSQAYSSSFTAGQTVRGQFSTLCSMLPNITGAATYIGHSTVQLRCIQELLRENGYRTTWMNTFRASFHGKRTFEQLHGTELFFDGEAFAARGVAGRVGTIGLADEPFLQDVVALVEELSQQGRPVFANVLTISVHHPYTVVDEGKLPEQLVRATGDRKFYRGYLSRLRYEDRALGAFFRAFFASPIADNTVVLLLADHSSGIQPHLDLTDLQRQEIRFRIPVALVTRDMPAPEVVRDPVHQVDVAPTIAAITGAKGEVTWVGRGLFGRQGRPFVYQDNQGLTYRTSRRACYNLGGPRPLGCISVDDADPLLVPAIDAVAEDEAVTAFFRNTVLANVRAIALNLVVPPLDSH